MVLQVVRGVISNYKCKRDYANFVFDDSDKTKFGAIAIAAGLVGLSGQAISTATSASSMEEAADYLEFEIDSKPVKGWVWCSPFQEGETVEVVGEWLGDHFEAYAVARPEDRIVALYPHCSKGAKKHVKTAVEWWIKGTALVLIFGWLFFAFMHFIVLSDDAKSNSFIGFSPAFLLIGGIFYGLSGLLTYSLTRKWMPFVRLSESVFKAFGWANPGEIDLVKHSQETEGQPVRIPPPMIEEDKPYVDPDPNLPAFLRKPPPMTIEQLRQAAEALPEPERSQELQRIAESEKYEAENKAYLDSLDEARRNVIRDAYGVMYFRY